MNALELEETTPNCKIGTQVGIWLWKGSCGRGGPA
jgi:hypothetical protein